MHDSCVSPRSAAPLDRIDRLLIEAVESRGRATLPELAAAVRLSPSACQRRLRRLEADGVIRGYRAVLDPVAVGRSLVVFVAIALTDHSRSTVQAFERAVVALEGLVSCHHVTGDTDYLLRVDVRDVDALDELIRERLTEVPGVARYTTSVATAAIVDRATDVAPRPGTAARGS